MHLGETESMLDFAVVSGESPCVPFWLAWLIPKKKQLKIAAISDLDKSCSFTGSAGTVGK